MLFNFFLTLDISRYKQSQKLLLTFQQLLKIESVASIVGPYRDVAFSLGRHPEFLLQKRSYHATLHGLFKVETDIVL